MADDNDSFENRLKALADQLARSLSDTDVDEVAERFGVDPERVRGVTGAVERWLNDRGSDVTPLFGDRPQWMGQTPRGAGNDPSSVHEQDESTSSQPARTGSGPHPLDLPGEAQGRALAALDSGRWSVRPGSSELVQHGPGPQPSGGVSDLVNELRARDWITADGTVTGGGRQALLRWTRATDDTE